MINTILNDPFRVFFVMLAIVVILVVVIGEIVSWFKKAEVTPDEFEDRDDAFAMLYHEPSGSSILSGRFQPSAYTCYWCDSAGSCPHAYDDYCLDNDCLNK